MYTQTTIRSHCTSEVYAERGLEVIIVAEHGDVMICEAGGKFFPVCSVDLGEGRPEEIEPEVVKPFDLFNQG